MLSFDPQVNNMQSIAQIIVFFPILTLSNCFCQVKQNPIRVYFSLTNKLSCLLIVYISIVYAKNENSETGISIIQ
jgi:hypothetical protein